MTRLSPLLKQFSKPLKRFAFSYSGASAIEYGLLIALGGMGIYGAFLAFQGDIIAFIDSGVGQAVSAATK